MKNIFYIVCFLYCTLSIKNTFGWGSSSNQKILLKDVTTLTLYDGKMTNGRRSSPVPQIACINEGSAPCYNFKPRSVQCINKGSDGVDTQWECKSDMDSRYKFGFIEVSCEGYDYPNDPYILAGSCGLKYTLDNSGNSGDHSNGNNYYGSSPYNSYKKSSMSGGFADILAYAGIALIIYAIYKTCFRSTRNVGENAYSTTNDDDPSDSRGGGYGWFGGNNSTHHQSSSSQSDDASCGSRGQTRQGGGSGLGGFWTGAATGGLLGYMFGGGRNSSYGYGTRGYGGYGGSSYGSGGMFGGGGSGFGSSGGYSGTRTSTAFGGTSRR